MAEDSLTSRADGTGTRFSLAYVRAFAGEHRVALITVAISLVSLIIYRLMWYLPGLEGPSETVQNNFVRQADAFLSGRIDMGPNGGQIESFIELAINDGKYYIVPPPMPAIIILPGVMIWGLALNQTLVSAVIGAVNSGTVYNVTRSVSKRLSTQIWLTLLVGLGTVYWYTASNGAVWFFSHTVAVLFLFLAIYFTLGRKNPLMAGLCLGAAYWSRAPTILTFPFFLIMFSDDWLVWEKDRPLLKRINWQPLLYLCWGWEPSSSSASCTTTCVGARHWMRASTTCRTGYWRSPGSTAARLIHAIYLDTSFCSSRAPLLSLPGSPTCSATSTGRRCG